MANDTQKFDDTLIGRESRESAYRTWSERAVIVGFNAETESYDIVITTEKTLGDNIRSLNRTIRSVKAVIDPNTDIFLPGESVIVGYVDDRREHPVIVGLGDSSGHTCIKVTLGVTSTTPTVEGPVAPSISEPEFNIFFPLGITCLDPNVLGESGPAGGTCTIDCSVADPEIRFTAQFGQPPYTWTLPVEGHAGCTFRGVVGIGEPTPDGVNNSRLVVTRPDSSTLMDDSYKLEFDVGWCKRDFLFNPIRPDPRCIGEGSGPGATCLASNDRCCVLDVNGTLCITKIFTCEDEPNASNCGSGCTNEFPAGRPAEVIAIAPAFFFNPDCAYTFGWWVGTEWPGVSPNTPNSCPDIENKLVTSNTVTDVRSEATKAAGCCPCKLAYNGLIVTVTDSQNTSISVTVTVAGTLPVDQ